jgi:putative transposase
MDTRETTAEFRMSQWTKIIQSRIDSGLSIKDFCKTNGISRNAFFYWQKKLREKAYAEIEAAEKTKSIVPGGWIQLVNGKIKLPGFGKENAPPIHKLLLVD